MKTITLNEAELNTLALAINALHLQADGLASSIQRQLSLQEPPTPTNEGG